MPCIETVLAIMNLYGTKPISMSRVSLRKLVTWISPCQRINTLVHTKDILRVSVFQNVSIITRGINVWRCVTPVLLMSDVLWHDGSQHSIVQIHISFPYVPLLLFACPFAHHLYDYSHTVRMKTLTINYAYTVTWLVR